jgi:hypothetical protein
LKSTGLITAVLTPWIRSSARLGLLLKTIRTDVESP